MPSVIQIGSEVDTSGLMALDAAAAETAAVLEALAAEFKKVELSSAEAAAKGESSFLQLREAATGAMEGIGSAATSAGGGLAALGAALGIGVVTEFINHMKEATLEVSHLSEATGISVASLTVLKDAMSAAGVSTERLPQQMTLLASAMEAAADGSQKQVDAFAALGINTANWAKEMPSELDVMMQIADHAHKSSDSIRDLSAEKIVLGRNAVALAGFLKQGSAAIQDEEGHFKAHGAAMEANVENALKLQRAETEFKTTLETELAPALKYVVDFFTGLSIMLVYVKAGWTDLIAVGGIVVATLDMVGAVMGRLIHMDFKGAVEAERAGLMQMAQAWVDAKNVMIAQANEAEKKTNEIMARANAPVAKPDEGGGPTAGLRRPGASAQEALDVQKRIGEAKAKLEEEQAKYSLVISQQTSQAQILETQIATTKNLEEKRGYIEQLKALMEEQARTEKDIALTAETAKFSADEESIHKSLALHQSASEQDKKERVKLNGDLQVLELQHQAAMARIATQFETQLAGARKKAATDSARIDEEEAARAQKMQQQILEGQMASIDGQIKALDDGVKRQVAVIQQAAKQHQITASSEHDQIVALYQKEYQDRVDLMHKKEAIYIQEQIAAAAAEGRVLTEEQAKLLPGYQKLYQQELEDYQSFLTKKQQADLAANQKLQQESEKTAQMLATGYDQMILHATSFHDAVSNLWGSLEKNFEQAVTHMIAAWITSMLEGKMVSAETALGQVMNSAYQSAANVYAATSGIPIIGPVLAPVAAAAAFTAVMAFGGGIGSAEQGAVLPQDMMILAHRNEMILPPALSQGFQAMIHGGTSPGGQAAPAHITYAPQVSGIDGPSIKRVLEQHATVVADNMKALVKGGRVSAADFMRG